MAMSRDALTEATVKSLVSQILPRLTQQLTAILKTKEPQKAIEQSLLELVNEAIELLQLLKPATIQTSPDISDDDALAMISELDSPSDSSMMDDLASEVAAEIAAEVAAESGSFKSAPQPAAAETPSAPISDDEAMLLLMEMDNAGNSETTSANQETTPDAASTVDSPMSDDDAMRLLMEMDGDSTSQSAPNVTNEASNMPAQMSDDDAMRLLTEMDEPTAEIKTEIRGVYENPRLTAEASPVTDDMDDETAKMMAELEAQSLAPTPSSAPAVFTASTHSTTHSKAATTPHANAEAHDTNDDEDANVEEINEWDENQFSSDPEMLKDFVTNTNDLMEQLDQTVLQLEQDPSNKETIEAIFRAAHTLKGAAGMFGYRAIERVMHRMENLFDLVRKGKLVPSAETIDVVFQGLDVLKKLLEAVAVNRKSGLKTAPIVRALSLAAKGKFSKPQAAPNAPSAAQTASVAAVGAPTITNPAPVVIKQNVGPPQNNDNSGKKKEEQSTIRVDLERLDALVNLVGELVIDRTRFATIEEELRTTAPHLKAGSNMTETVQLFGRHMNEIQDIIMKVRMVPIGNAFNKFPRVVRDLARQLGKQMDLLIDGEATELDKTLVEQIADPLVHLIRNACDHGIEKPAERISNGKNGTGKIMLAAKQEGNHIVISISDDGKGMNVEKIRAKGIERGLISADANISDREIFNLIFESGFSTAEAVTTVSGRGVGMDVVRKQIAKLKGMVEINSVYGKGSTITITLPLTLAIVESLLVTCQGETFAIPLSSVIESERIKPSDIQKVGDAEVIKLRNNILPLIHLNQTLDLDRKANDSWYSEPRSNANDKRGRKQERLFVVVVGSANQRFGIVVDQLLNQQEMVIKPMGPIMRKTPCVAGGAVLGNGEVVLVLDIQDLIENFRVRARNQNLAS